MKSFSLRFLLPAIAGAVGGWLLTPLWMAPAATAQNRRIPQRHDAGSGHKAPEIDRLIKAVHAAGGPSAQINASLQLAASLAPQDFGVMLENARFLPAHASQAIFIQSVLRRWTEHDPAAAAKWCQGNASKQLGEVVRLWAAQDVRGATAFLATLPQDDRIKAVAGCAEAMAATDPAAALAFIARRAAPESQYELREAFRLMAVKDPQWLLTQGETLLASLRTVAREAAALEMAAKDLAGAAAWAAGEPDGPGLLRTVFGRAGDPAEALAVLASLPPALQQNVSGYQLARKDPQKFLSLLATTPNLSDPLVQNLLSSTVYYAAEKDPAAATAELQTSFPQYLDQHAGPLAKQWAGRDAAAAREWAASLPEGKVREAALTAIASEENRTGAAVPASPVESLIADLKSGRSAGDATRILMLNEVDRAALLGELGNLKQTNYTSNRTLESMQTYFPSEYGAWLASRGEDEKSQNAITQHVSKWAAEDAPAAASWVEQLPAGGAKTNAVSNLVLQWAALDPASARQWVDALPQGPERTSAQQSLAGEPPPQ